MISAIEESSPIPSSVAPAREDTVARMCMQWSHDWSGHMHVLGVQEGGGEAPEKPVGQK